MVYKSEVHDGEDANVGGLLLGVAKWLLAGENYMPGGLNNCFVACGVGTFM